ISLPADLSGHIFDFLPELIHIATLFILTKLIESGQTDLYTLHHIDSSAGIAEMLHPNFIQRPAGSIESLLSIVICVVVRKADGFYAACSQNVCILRPAIEPVIVSVVIFFSLVCLIAQDTLKIGYRKVILLQHLHGI